MDWTKVSKELAKDLDASKVKPPPQGKYGSYIEGWWAIDEANRVFGFGGWSYCVDNLTVTNNDLRGDKWAIGYLATVTVTVEGVSRQDVGHGQGFSKSPGDAHDSAVKEAVTDALKRALRTFGYRFGLALYDKTKAHVSDDPNADEKREDWDRRVSEAVNYIGQIGTLEALAAYWKNLNAMDQIVTDNRVIAAKDKRKAELSQQNEEAA